MRALNYTQPHSLCQLIGGLTAGRAGRKGSEPSEDSLSYYPVCTNLYRALFLGALELKVSLSKWGQTAAKVKLKRSQSVDILTLPTVWPLYPDLSLSSAPLPRVCLQFIQAYPHILSTLSAVLYSWLTTSYSFFDCTAAAWPPSYRSLATQCGSSKFTTSMPFLSIGFRVPCHADPLYVIIYN